MFIEERIDYQQLSRKVGNDNEIQSALKEGYEILLKVKDIPQLYDKFEKEYHDLYKSIKEAFENDKKFSQEERVKIMFELSDIFQIAQNNGVVETKGTISKIGDWLKGTHNNEIKVHAQALREKNIKDFSIDEAIFAMNYLRYNYKNYKEIGKDDKLVKGLTFQYSSINELDDKYEVRLFQENLLKIIFPNQAGFNDKYIAGFDNEQGNYIIEISNFEKRLVGSKMDNINSRALANYFSYISSKKELTKEVILEILSPEQYKHLLDLWKNNPNSIAQKILSTQESSTKKDVIGNFFKYFDTLDEKNSISEIQKDPSKIFLVSDKDTLIKCIKTVPSISYKNINSYMQLDIDVITEISKKDSEFNIKSIPQSFFQIEANNKDDREKIKKLFLIGKNESDYLKIISELSISIGDGQIQEFINALKNDENMKGYKTFFDGLSKYTNQINSLNQKDFENACNNLLKNRNSDDITRINLYIYKNGIQGREEKLLSLFQYYKLEDFPGIHKHLYENQNFATKLISKHPEEFKNLSSTLQKKDYLVNAFLDASIKKEFNYRNLLEVIEQIELGKNISIVLLVYDKLSSKYGEEKVNNLFLHEKMSQKMQVFFKNMDGTSQSEGQKEALKKLNGVFEKLILEFENAKNTINGFQEKYKKYENKDKDQIILDKIGKITGLGEKENKLIFEILKKPVSEQNSRTLLGLLKKFTEGNNKKVIEILSQLQNLQIENIKTELKEQAQKGKENGISTEKIDAILIQNPKGKNENNEDYKKRIGEIFDKQNGKLNEEQRKIFKNYLQGKLSIATLEYQNKNINLYVAYLENPEKFTSFEEYKETKNPQTEASSGENSNFSSLQKVTYPSGMSLDYMHDGGNYNLFLENGEKIAINENEFKTISSSQEALKNMINFKETLDELNLSKLWHYRESIFTGIKNNHLFQINTNEDYINKDELKVFLRSILVALDIPCNVPNTLEDIKGEIFLINNGGILNTAPEDVNIYGESSIENKFIQKFTDDRKNSPEMVTQLFSEGLAKNS